MEWDKELELLVTCRNDEVMDDELKEAFRVLDDDIPYDSFVVFKQVTEDKASYSPRIFRNNVLFEEGLIPIDFENMRKEYLLNGCIRNAFQD